MSQETDVPTALGALLELLHHADDPFTTARTSLASATRCPTRSSRARAKRTQSLHGIRIRDEGAEPVAIGSSQLGEYEVVEAVARAARRAELRSHRGDLVEWIAITDGPPSNSRSTSNPSRHSIAIDSTPEPDRCPHGVLILPSS